MKAVVIGNGESRKWFAEKEYYRWIKGVTWGCNAIYREKNVIVDNLVAVDYGMQQEIYNTGYPLTNIEGGRCYFRNWSIVPSSVADMMFMGFNIPDELIHRSNKYTKNCVIQGKDPNTLQEKIEVAIKLNPHLDTKDLVMKMEKDMGVWITYVEENDNVNPIIFPIGWSTGNTALHLACQDGATEVYILGFDLSSYDEPLNNIYKGTDNYLSSDAKGFSPTNWKNQMQTVFKEFQKIKFYWIDAKKEFIQEKNLRYLTKAEFYDTVVTL